jgi:hypothetical protein
VRLEVFVDDYYSVEKFQTAYKRVVVPLRDKSFWPEVDIRVPVEAHLVKRPIGWQRKTRMKGYLEGRSGKKKSGKQKEKTKEIVLRMVQCPNYGGLGHRKNNPKC